MIHINEEKRKFFAPKISYLRNFISDNSVIEGDSIALAEPVFDDLALNYRHTYNEPIPEPFVFLGVWIKIADRGTINPHYALIRHYDSPPIFNAKPAIAKVYRCGYCGNLLDEYENELQGDARALASQRWKEYGESIFTAMVGKCCEMKSRNKPNIAG